MWEQALGDFSKMGLSFRSIPFATADLDGDGVKDILFCLPVAEPELATAGNVKRDAGSTLPAGKSMPSLPRPLGQLLAYSGRDGKLLWRRPWFVGDPSSFASFPRRSSAIPGGTAIRSSSLPTKG